MKKKSREEKLEALEEEEVVEVKQEELTPSNKLNLESDDLTNQIISEKDPDKLNDLAALFDLNQKKKQIVRKNKLSNLIDKIDNEVESRLSSNPEFIEDSDLARYWTTTQSMLRGDGEEKTELPRVQINNQTNIHVNSSGLNRESRAKVLDVVNQILNSLPDDRKCDIIDIEPNKKEDR